MEKETKENWEGNLADKIIRLEYPTYENAFPKLKEAIIKIRNEITELLRFEKEELLKRIKLEYDEPINRDTKQITKEQSNYWVDGYNKAVEDLEKLKRIMKKEKIEKFVGERVKKLFKS